MPIIAASAPSRKRFNRFEVVSVILNSFAMEVYVAIRDEDGDLVKTPVLKHTGQTWQTLSYDDDGDLVVSTSDAPAGSLLADFNSFANTVGGFGARAQNLESRLVNTGRLPG